MGQPSGAHAPLAVSIDLGTSAVKALVIDPGGHVLARANVTYPSATPQPGWIEQATEDWWAAARTALHACWNQLAAAGRQVSQVEAVGLSGHMSGLVLLDGRGDPVGPCITISDTRATGQAARLAATIGEAVRRITGNPIIGAFTLPKLVWVREHAPDWFRKAVRLLLPKDYVRYRLTGVIATEPTDAGNTLLLDPLGRVWSGELCQAADVPRRLLPDLVESGAIAGRVTPEAAAATGLPVGTRVVGGGADMACSNIGIGAVRTGLIAVTMGTAAQVVADVARIVDGLFGKMTFHPQAAPGSLYAMGSHFTGGLGMAWLADALGAGFEELEADAAACPPGAEGVLFLPFLVGGGTPYFDSYLSGTWLGLRTGHRRGHLARSVMEGVAFNIRESVELLHRFGVGAAEIRIGAGGARSQLWRQILAGVLGARGGAAEGAVTPVEVTDVSAFGAALLAGVGAGWWPSVAEATRETVRLGSPVEVPAGWAQAYARLYPRYLEAVRWATGLYADVLAR